MKTNYFSSSKSTSIFYLILGFSMVMVSCGSFKSSTYYDRDGIYGTDEKETKTTEKNADKYKAYFSSLREQNEQEQVFTDVENYSSVQDSINNSPTGTTSYSGWGNNQQPINITIYDNNWGWNNFGYNSYWNNGWNWNLGWNSWYGSSIGYGWGWNNWYGPGYGNYGWGWNNWYYPYYGYNGYNGYNSNSYQYSYSNGIRGGRSAGRVSGRYDFGRSGIVNTRDYNNIGRRNFTNSVRNSDQSTPRNYNSVRSTDVNTRTENSSTRAEVSTRVTNETPRNYTPVRVQSTYPSSENSSPRSYSPSSGGGDFGGGRSGGSGGGGRR